MTLSTIIARDVFMLIYGKKYLTELVEFNVNLYLENDGLRLQLQGFNDTLRRLFLEIVQNIKSFKSEDHHDLFKTFYEQKVQNLKNFCKENPYKIAMDHFTMLMRTGARYSMDEFINHIQNVTFEKFCQFTKEWMNHVRFEWLIVGNIQKKDAENMIIENNEILKGSKILKKNEVWVSKASKLSENEIILYEDLINQNPEEQNSAIVVHYQDQKETPQSRVMIKFIRSLIDESCFEQLRTNEQLGYAVWSYDECVRGIQGYSFIIVSNVADPHHLSIRISEFLKQKKKFLEEMTDEEFDEEKESLLIELTQKDNNLFETSDRYLDEIQKHQYIFDRKQVDEKIITNITKDEILKYFDQLFLNSFKKIEIHQINQKHAELQKKNANERNSNINYVKEYAQFKTKCQQYPDYFSICQ